MLVPPNHWWPVCDSTRLRAGEALGLRRFGRRLVVWRDSAGGVHCADDRCPHRGSAFTHPKSWPWRMWKIQRFLDRGGDGPRARRLGRVVDGKS